MRINKEDDSTYLGKYIWAIWRSEGKEFNICELCGKFTKKPEIHHTKYEGSTIKDLIIACRKCQMKPENVGLL